MLEVQLLSGGSAVVTKLRNSPPPKILHLATHGFFLEELAEDHNFKLGQKDNINKKEKSSYYNIPLDSLQSNGHSYSKPDLNPLLFSGLALAGANTWLAGKPVPAEAEQGVLTAEEVAVLDLSETELVVLSACETGLGTIRTGEGVFGLRRAFMLAGANTLVMSLWKVADQQTRELMVNFYKNILNNQSRSHSLRKAQLALKTTCPDPYYWGAFICQGNPGIIPDLQ